MIELATVGGDIMCSKVNKLLKSNCYNSVAFGYSDCSHFLLYLDESIPLSPGESLISNIHIMVVNY